MNNIDKLEINNLLKKYQCVKTAKIILNHLCISSNRINKAALMRSGYKEEEIQIMVDKLRSVLFHYGGY